MRTVTRLEPDPLSLAEGVAPDVEGGAYGDDLGNQGVHACSSLGVRMFNLKRSVITLSPIVMAALVAVVALTSTPSGAAALRIASDRLGVTAHAAGGGGGAGVDGLTGSRGTAVAKLAGSPQGTHIW